MDVKGLRRRIVDSPDSLGGRARARRWELFQRFFPDIHELSVLDLGGTVETWRRSPVKPAKVTIINLFEPGESTEATVIPLTGDACAAGEVLTAAEVDLDFDLIFSNSLIEHVGGHAKRLELAREVRHLAPRHWIQTPYRYFPLEPHWIFPGMQFLPATIRTQIAAHWPLAHTRPDNIASARESVLWTELVSVTEMRDYFPDSEILHERMVGLTKSLIAVR